MCAVQAARRIRELSGLYCPDTYGVDIHCCVKGYQLVALPTESLAGDQAVGDGGSSDLIVEYIEEP